MTTAHAAVLTGPRKLEFQDFPLPEIGADDGLLRVEANGLCGTDYHQYRCEYKLDGGKLPIIPGHEPIGWIERIGANAAKRWNLSEGDRVVVKRRCLVAIAGNARWGRRNAARGEWVTVCCCRSMWRRACGVDTRRISICIRTHK